MKERKLQITGHPDAKRQAPSALKKPQMIFKTILEFEKDKT